MNINKKILANIPLSALVYGTPMHAHYMDLAEIDDKTKEQMIYIADSLQLGRRMNEAKRKFLESGEYKLAQHKCDLVSGEYIKMLSHAAKECFVSHGKIAAGDFEVYLSHPEKEVLPDFAKAENAFYCWNKKGVKYSVTLEQVERTLGIIR